MSEHHELSEHQRQRGVWLRQFCIDVGLGDKGGTWDASLSLDVAADALDAEKARAAEAEVARLRDQYESAEDELHDTFHRWQAAEAKLAAIEALHQPHVTVDGSVTR